MRVEPLDASSHDRQDFDCERTELNDWLAKYARQAQASGSARTFVLTEDGNAVVGYYALTSHSVDVDAVNAALAKGLSRHYPIPAVLLSRLAISTDCQRMGLGERLLADAIRRVTAASEHVGIALLVVDAIDDQAVSFYEKYGFLRWPADGMRLFARISDIATTMRT